MGKDPLEVLEGRTFEIPHRNRRKWALGHGQGVLSSNLETFFPEL